MHKILIVVSSDALIPELDAGYDITICHTAEDAASLLQQQFDGMILDLFLPGPDGLTLLEENQDRLPPVILALTYLISPYILQSAEALGVGHIIRLPFSPAEVNRRLRDMFLKLESPVSCATASDARYHLQRLGITCGKGYRRMLAILPDFDPDDPPCLFSDFYPALARKESVTMDAIDNSIHRTIQNAYSCRKDAVWQEYFPDTSSCPKNKEFLSAIAEKLKEKPPSR